MEVWRLATGVATWRNGGKYELATGVVPEVLNVLEGALIAPQEVPLPPEGAPPESDDAEAM